MWSPLGILAALIVGSGSGIAEGPILLADDAHTPHIRVAWTRSDGTESSFEADLPYRSPEERSPIGGNLEAYVALGGVRLEKGAGHPDGAILSVGLHKLEMGRLFFEDIANGSTIRLEVSNVVFNQAVVPDVSTVVQRMEYEVDDVVACGLTIDQTEMFNVASPDDDMGGMILPQQVRFGSLRLEESGGVVLRVEDDGSVTMRAEIPYGLLRHKGDPWMLEVPGTFFEPIEMHLECEVLPADIAAAEGISLPKDPGR